MPVTRPKLEIDFDRLLKLRVLVARFGEMDLAKWWNTKGQLGRVGAVALKRGFPRTHHFAQARSVFAVAAQRCEEIFDPPGSATLWRLPEWLEEEFDQRWEGWLDDAASWVPFFERAAAIAGDDLASVLRSFDLVSQADLECLGKLRRSSDLRAVPLSGAFAPTDADVTLLALGFARGEPSRLAVPYARRDDV